MAKTKHRDRPSKCPFCGSLSSIGKGMHRTKTMGVRRIRRCRDCGRKFTPRYQRRVDEHELQHEQQ